MATFRTTKDIYAIKAPASGSVELSDARTPGLRLRISAKRQHRWPRTWVYLARYPGTDNPTRAVLGDYPDMDLDVARTMAGEWRAKIRDGHDPRDERAQRKKAARRARAQTFDGAADAYLAKQVTDGKRRVMVVERILKNDIRPTLGSRPLTKITADDVRTLVEDVKARGTGAGSYARNVLQIVASVFAHAAGSRDFTLPINPCATLKPADVVGAKQRRKRVLLNGTDLSEMRTYWVAAGALGYPYAPLCQLIALTGCRRAEIAHARWREFDPRLMELLRSGEAVDWATVPSDVRMLTIPSERFKTGETHMVPLSVAACEILATLPHFKGGDYLFSTRDGTVPVDGFSKAVGRLRREMAKLSGSEPVPFGLHDVRRTFRSALSLLRVRTEVAELCIGHSLQGMVAVYDQYSWLDERREAFELWARKLDSVLHPAASNVVQLKAAG